MSGETATISLHTFWKKLKRQININVKTQLSNSKYHPNASLHSVSSPHSLHLNYNNKKRLYIIISAVCSVYISPLYDVWKVRTMMCIISAIWSVWDVRTKDVSPLCRMCGYPHFDRTGLDLPGRFVGQRSILGIDKLIEYWWAWWDLHFEPFRLMAAFYMILPISVLYRSYRYVCVCVCVGVVTLILQHRRGRTLKNSSRNDQVTTLNRKRTLETPNTTSDLQPGVEQRRYSGLESLSHAKCTKLKVT